MRSLPKIRGRARRGCVLRKGGGMIRLGTFVWLATPRTISASAPIKVELGVLAKESELRQINRQIDANPLKRPMCWRRSGAI